MGTHIREAALKADKTTAKLNRIYPNIRGPRAGKTKVLVSVVNSMVLYAASIWADWA